MMGSFSIRANDIRLHMALEDEPQPLFLGHYNQSFYDETEKHFGPLLKSFRCMFYSDNGDVTVTVGDRSFRVHRHILAARSSVFADMFADDLEEKSSITLLLADFVKGIVEIFLYYLYTGGVIGPGEGAEHNLQEKPSNTVVITDFEEDIVESFFHYLYTGAVIDPDKTAGELLKMAEKYDVPALSEFCCSALKEGVNDTNCVNTLLLADRYQKKELKRVAMAYIVKKGANYDTLEGYEQLGHNRRLMFELVDVLVGTKYPSDTLSPAENNMKRRLLFTSHP